MVLHHPCGCGGILLCQSQSEGLDVVRPLPMGVFQRDEGMALFHAFGREADVF